MKMATATVQLLSLGVKLSFPSSMAAFGRCDSFRRPDTNSLTSQIWVVVLGDQTRETESASAVESAD